MALTILLLEHINRLLTHNETPPLSDHSEITPTYRSNNGCRAQVVLGCDGPSEVHVELRILEGIVSDRLFSNSM